MPRLGARKVSAQLPLKRLEAGPYETIHCGWVGKELLPPLLLNYYRGEEIGPEFVSRAWRRYATLVRLVAFICLIVYISNMNLNGALQLVCDYPSEGVTPDARGLSPSEEISSGNSGSSEPSIFVWERDLEALARLPRAGSGVAKRCGGRACPSKPQTKNMDPSRNLFVTNSYSGAPNRDMRDLRMMSAPNAVL